MTRKNANLRNTFLVATLMLPALFAQHQFPPHSTPPAPAFAPGLEFPHIGHEVADLDKSIRWFTAIRFQVVEGPSSWTVDEALNKLGNTPGAESRSAVLKTQGEGNAPFTLVLRQYRGISQQDWSKRQAGEAGRGGGSYARAFLQDLGVVPELKPANPFLPVLSTGTPITREPGGLARMEDLDGFIFDAHATDQGLKVPDSSRTIGFTLQTANVQDINANYAAFQVGDIDAVYARAKENGATTVTDGGVIHYNGGRAVMLRDPYLNSFILLWQPAN